MIAQLKLAELKLAKYIGIEQFNNCHRFGKTILDDRPGKRLF